MKTQKKSSQRLYLDTRNNRWKWMVVGTAATAAGVNASEAGLVTINLSGNGIDAGNHLNADLTGDGHPDLTIANARYSFFSAGVSLNGVHASFQVHYGTYDGHALMQLGLQGAHFDWTYNPNIYPHQQTGTPSVTGSIPIFFKDLHINAGAPTSGSLQVTVFPTEIQLDSFTYNSNTAVAGASVTVPDQGSSLGLLTMGAGGILALRRWRAGKDARSFDVIQ
jgi:hypothetical protein